MKKFKILIIITFLSISTVFCQIVETQQQNIEIQEIDVVCPLIGEETLIIKNQKEYDQYFNRCSSNQKIDIDFDTYTLIGFCSKEVRGCTTPYYEYNYYKKNGKYFMDIKFRQNGSCGEYFYIRKWFLVPKLPLKENITFNVTIEEQEDLEIIEMPVNSLICSNFSHIDQYFVIKNQEDFEKVFYCSSALSIDFDKYSIIGFYETRGDSNNISNYKYHFYMKNDNYIMEIYIYNNGRFFQKIRIMRSFLIPKLKENEDIIFKFKEYLVGQ